MLRFVNRVAKLLGPLPAARLPRVSLYSTTANPPTSDVDIKFQVSYTTNTDPPITQDFAAAAKVLESCANSMHVDVKKTDNGTIFNVHELNKISSKQLLNRISILLDEPTTQIKDVNILAGKVDTKHKYNLNLSIKRVWTEKADAKENSTTEKMEKEMEGSKKMEKKDLEKKMEMEKMEGSKKMEKKDLEKKMEMEKMEKEMEGSKKMEKKELEKKMEMEGSKKMEKKDLEKEMEGSKKMEKKESEKKMEMEGSKKMEKKDLEEKKDLQEVSKSTTCTYEMVDEKFMIWKLCKLFTMQNEEVVELKVRMRKKNKEVKHSDSIQFVVERPTTEEQSKKMEEKDSEKKKDPKGFKCSTTYQELDEVYLIDIFFALFKLQNEEVAEVNVRMRKNEGGVKHPNLIKYTVERPVWGY